MIRTSQRPTVVRRTLTPLLVCFILLPPVLAYVGPASSMAMGTMIACCFALAFGVLRISTRSVTSAIKYLALVLVCVILHLLVSSALGPVNLSRSFASLLPLCFCFFGAWATAELFNHAHNDDLARNLKWMLLLLGSIALLGALGWLQPTTSGTYAKPVFPFSEPSHLAMVSAPFLIYACVTSRPLVRVLYLTAALLTTALLESLTLAAVIILASGLSIKPRYLVSIAFVSSPILFTLDLSYYLERLVFNDQSQNLSALVYLQGWQLLQESLERTSGLGVGFQQLGVLGTNVTAANQIDLLLGNSLNLLDGGFNLAKLLSEFGIFGGILMIAYMIFVFRAMRLLRRVALKGEQHLTVIVFAASCIVSYLIEMLVRGTGYFTPTGVLLVTAVLLWRRHAVPKNIRVSSVSIHTLPVAGAT